MDSESPPSHGQIHTVNENSLPVRGTSLSRITAIVLGIAVLVTLGFESKVVFSKSVVATTSVSTTSIASVTSAALPVLPSAALRGASRNDVVLVPVRSGVGSSKLRHYAPHGSTFIFSTLVRGPGHLRSRDIFGSHLVHK